jgi:hypothetical protein
MPVENPSIEYPNKAYINSLIPDWPTGSDFPSDGDDHIRGIKNVLKQTFPKLTGPITLTQDEINSGSKLLEPGTVCLFYQNKAPTGWQRVNPSVGNRMIIITSGGAGLEGGGPDEPTFNNKTPYHNHLVSGGTGVENANHSHGVTLAGGDHQHVYRTSRTWVKLYIASGGGPWNLVHGNNVNDGYATEGGGTGNGGHYHTGNTTGISNNHAHAVNIASQPNAGAANWTPRWTACILARRV